jgi:hypothetical protein
MRGFEVMILVAGVPIAAAGLVDNDGGVWRSYSNTIVKVFVTTIIQIVLVRIGISLLMSGDITKIVGGIAALVLGVTSPKLVREFLIPSSAGEGALSKAHHATSLVRTIKGVAK